MKTISIKTLALTSLVVAGSFMVSGASADTTTKTIKESIKAGCTKGFFGAGCTARANSCYKVEDGLVIKEASIKRLPTMSGINPKCEITKQTETEVCGSVIVESGSGIGNKSAFVQCTLTYIIEK